MANPDHVRLLRQGTAAWHQSRLAGRLGETTSGPPDLSGADLSFLDLRCADLRNADCRGARLKSAILREANLTGADLEGADLADADLSQAYLISASLLGVRLDRASLHHADLTGASLLGTTLIETDFRNADLYNVDLTGATLASTLLVDVNLQKVKGLNHCSHLGPSILDSNTLIRLPSDTAVDRFLSDCGIPNFLIEHLPLWRKAGSPFFSCFISYSSRDEAFCDRLSKDLRARQIRVWNYKTDGTVGRPVWPQIEESIAAHEKMIIVCSEHSLESKPVLWELERVLDRERSEQRDLLFPIRIDNYVFTWNHPYSVSLRNRVIGDFTGWQANPATYGDSLVKLTRALQTTSNGHGA